MNPRVLTFAEPPTNFPVEQVDGRDLKSLLTAVVERRATSHFRPDPVPERYLEAILRFGLQAPSGYNLQPWRFLVLRDAESRKRLRAAAMDQKKITEAPVVLVAFGVMNEWREQMDAIFREAVRRGVVAPEGLLDLKSGATAFLDDVPAAVWINRQVMIAVTTMMLVAEAYGLNTAPMEGFDPEAVRHEFGLPKAAEVVALLAMGYAAAPRKKYGGRVQLEHAVFLERYGQSWPATGSGDEPTGAETDDVPRVAPLAAPVMAEGWARTPDWARATYPSVPLLSPPWISRTLLL